MEIDRRFAFSGHVIGAAAHIHRIDDVHDLDHNIAALGSSAIPIVGGHSHHRVAHFCYTASHPRKLSLLSAQRVETTAHGKCLPNQQYLSEISATVKSLGVVEKMHVDLVTMYQRSLATYDPKQDVSASFILTSKAKIEGLRLGNVEVEVDVDEEPFATCGTRADLDAFYQRQGGPYRKANCERFNTPEGDKSIKSHHEKYVCSLVSKIVLKGPEAEQQKIHVDGYSIYWEGFGRIYLGEVIVSDQDRKVTMIRLKLGSDAGGSGSIGDGQQNGGTVP